MRVFHTWQYCQCHHWWELHQGKSTWPLYDLVLSDSSRLYSHLTYLQEVIFGSLDASGKENGHGLLNGIENVMSHVYIPALKKMQKGWGSLDNSNSTVRHDFMNKLEAFVSTLVSKWYVPPLSLSLSASASQPQPLSLCLSVGLVIVQYNTLHPCIPMLNVSKYVQLALYSSWK